MTFGCSGQEVDPFWDQVDDNRPCHLVRYCDLTSFMWSIVIHNQTLGQVFNKAVENKSIDMGEVASADDFVELMVVGGTNWVMVTLYYGDIILCHMIMSPRWLTSGQDSDIWTPETSPDTLKGI